MTATSWSATSRSPAAGPSRWRRLGVRAGVALLLLGVVAWGAFTWLFYNPFEGEVADLDRCIPSSSAFALRGSAGDLLSADFVRGRLLRREEVTILLDRWGVDAGLRLLDERQAEMNGRLPGFLAGFDARTDLLGRETVLFGSPRPVRVITPEAPWDARLAVATRATPRARRLLSLLKHEFVRRRIEEDSGLVVTRYPLLCGIDASGFDPKPGWETIYLALVKDVLVVGNDRDLVTESAHLASTGGVGSLPDRLDAGGAFAAGATEPLRAFLDLARAAAAAEEAGEPTPGELLRDREGVAGLLGPLLDPDGLSTASVRLGFPAADRARLEVTAVLGGEDPSSLASDLSDGEVRPAGEALKEAALLAPAGSAVLAARLEVRVGSLIQVLEARAEPAVRKEIDGFLKEGRTGLAEIAAELDDHFARGISVVVERLPECDEISLNVFGVDPQGRFVLPLPGVLLALRQRPGIPAGSAEKLLRDRLGEWKGNLSVLEELEGLPPGMTGLRFRPKFLTGEKDLLRPAVAFEGDLVLLATSEGTLRRALEARGGGRPALSDFAGFEEACAAAGEGQACAFLEAGAALVMARDGRREAASAAIERNPVLERRAIHTRVATSWMNDRREIRQDEIQAEVDRQFDEWEREQREVAFPEAVREYLAGLEGWKAVRSGAGTLSRDAGGLRLSVVLRAAEEP